MDIGLLRPTNILQLIVKVVKVVDIGLKIPATLPQVITEVVYLGRVLPATLPLVIVEDMLIEVDIGHKRPAILPIEIRKQDFMLKVEVYIGLRPSTTSPITKVKVVGF